MPIDIVGTSVILDIVKVFLWLLFGLFVIFAVIVVRQVQLMNRVLSVPIAGGLRFVSYGLLLFALSIFGLSLVVL